MPQAVFSWRHNPFSQYYKVCCIVPSFHSVPTEQTPYCYPNTLLFLSFFYSFALFPSSPRNPSTRYPLALYSLSSRYPLVVSLPMSLPFHGHILTSRNSYPYYPTPAGIKKAWKSTIVVPLYEAFALPKSLEATTRSPRRYKQCRYAKPLHTCLPVSVETENHSEHPLFHPTTLSRCQWNGHLPVHFLAEYTYIPRTSTVALLWRDYWKLRSFIKPEQASINAYMLCFKAHGRDYAEEHNSLPLPRTCALVRKDTTKSARIQILEKLLGAIAVNIRVLPDNSKSQAAILFGQPQKKEK